MICSTCDAPVAVDSLKIWNSRTVCIDCFGVLGGQAVLQQSEPENPRTIRETTVCPACQAEFHKDHPMCPECNTVLDPAFRVARQTQRAAQEVSELVVENTRTTRRVAGYGLRLLISGFLWAVVVLSAFVLIFGLLNQKVTINWWGVPVSAAALAVTIWLARRISPGHFRPKTDDRPSDPTETPSLPVSTANNDVRLPTPRTAAVEMRNQPREIAHMFVFALVAPIGFITAFLVFGMWSDGSSTESAVLESEKTSLVTFQRDKAAEGKSQQDLFLEGTSAPVSRTSNDNFQNNPRQVQDLFDALDRQAERRREVDSSVDILAKRRANKARFDAMDAREEAEEKARRQRLGALEKIRETAGDFLVPRRR